MKYTKKEQIAVDVLEDLAHEFELKLCDCSPNRRTVIDVMPVEDGEIITYRCIDCGNEAVHKNKTDDYDIRAGAL